MSIPSPGHQSERPPRVPRSLAAYLMVSPSLLCSSVGKGPSPTRVQY